MKGAYPLLFRTFCLGWVAIENNHRSSFHALVSVVKNEGVKGLYRGRSALTQEGLGVRQTTRRLVLIHPFIPPRSCRLQGMSHVGYGDLRVAVCVLRAVSVVRHRITGFEWYVCVCVPLPNVYDVIPVLVPCRRLRKRQRFSLRRFGWRPCGLYHDSFRPCCLQVKDVIMFFSSGSFVHGDFDACFDAT
jgi:hypothetical protein